MPRKNFPLPPMTELHGLSPDEEEALAAQLAEERRDQIRPHIGLKNLRSRAGISQVNMAKKMGVSRKSYQLYENGGLPIPSDKIARVIAYFDVDIRELFYGKPFVADRSIKMDSAKTGIEAFVTLLGEHSDRFGTKLDDEEMKRVAMVYVRQHEPGEKLDSEDLWRCVQLVTDGKYLPRLDGSDIHESPG